MYKRKTSLALNQRFDNTGDEQNTQTAPPMSTRYTRQAVKTDNKQHMQKNKAIMALVKILTCHTVLQLW